MIKQLFISSLLMFTVCASASAQDLHIYYDVFNDTLWYKKDGVFTETPAVRKRDLVQLHIIEFNNYLYSVKTEQKEVSEEAGKIDVVNQFLPEGKFDMQGFLKSLPLGNLGAGLTGVKFPEWQGFAGNQNAGARGGDMDVQASYATETYDKLLSLSTQMDDMSKKIRELSKSIFAGTLSVDYIDDLLKSHDLPPTQIRKMVMEHLKLMFGTAFVEEPTLETALAWKDKADQFREYSAQMNQLIEKWNEEKPGYDRAVRRISQLCSDTSKAEKELVRGFQERRDEINLRHTLISGYTDSLGKVVELAAGVSADKLGALYRKTVEVKNHKFEYNETFKPIGKEMDLVLEINVKDSDKNTDPTRTRTVRVTNYEGFKYSITPGFCAAGFFTPQKRYSIALNSDNETIIAETDADKFVPLVTTAVQIYNDRGNRVTPGAMLGLAVPLTPNGGQSQALNFVAGPSLVVGRDQRISISIGIMGGKTTRLSEGVTPFQPFDTQNGVRPIPTVERYELGWYIGVTGNL